MIRFRLKVLAYLFIVFIFLTGFSNIDQESDKKYEIAKTTMAEINNITKQANDQLNKLELKNLKGQALFLEVKNITENHLKKIAPLQKKFNELPSSVKKSFRDSEEGVKCFNQISEGMKTMEEKATYLLRDLETLPFDLGSTKDLSKLSEEPVISSNSSRKQIDDVCEFIQFSINDTKNFSNSQKSDFITNLTNLRSSALKGGVEARFKINDLFKFFFNLVSSMNNPASQYNLGMFYKNYGDSERAKYWFTKSSKQGYSNSTNELKKIKN